MASTLIETRDLAREIVTLHRGLAKANTAIADLMEECIALRALVEALQQSAPPGRRVAVPLVIKPAILAR